jgi:hypothetical protein
MLGDRTIEKPNALLLGVLTIILASALGWAAPDPATDCNHNGKPDSQDLTTNTRAFRIFSDDFEGGKLEDNWIATGLWRIDKTECLDEVPPTDQDPPPQNDYRAAYNRDKDHCDYNTGSRNSGALEMATSVTIPAVGAELVWWNWVETEDTRDLDTWQVQVSANNGETWQTVFDHHGKSEPLWTQYTVSLYDYRQQKIKIRFVFDSRDSYNNNFKGWFIDDVAIWGYDAFSLDCNANSIPDECEPDCNANGIPDSCELAENSTLDCNSNGILDECESADEITTSSAKYSPFDVDHLPARFTFKPLPPARGKVRLDLIGYGNFGTAYTHRIDVYLNSNLLGNVRIRTGDSPCGSGMTSMILDAGLFNSLTRNSDQSATFRLVPGDEVAPRCESSYIQMGISYLTPDRALDCNGNALPDECDLASGTSRDCNANGIPDECDIADHTSEDCNRNRVPDECDLASGTSHDCNANEVPDECDLASGTSHDCNANEVPDECDVADLTSQDTNEDGIPDECQIEQDVTPCGSELTPSAIWFDDFENPAADRWTTAVLRGTNTWYYPPPPEELDPSSGMLNAWGGRYTSPSDSVLEMRDFVEIPTTVPCYLYFLHAHDFEYYPGNYDGGVVEYITDDLGTTWTDLGPLMDANGYRGKIALNYQNPLAGRNAFVGSSDGYIATRANLSSLAGKRVKIRFRVGTDWSGVSRGWYIDDVRFSACQFVTDEKTKEDFTQPPLGWVELSRVPSSDGLAATDYDNVQGALCARVSSDENHFRVVGWFTDTANRLPYASVGPDHYVRAKFYVYATGQSNPAQLNTIPNFRMRVANRFAVNSMLEVNAHVNASPGDEPVTLEVRPSTDPTKPSLYRVDFDPVDVPQLIIHPYTEGILRGFEAYCLDPQDNGAVCLTESSIGVYPKSWVSPEKSAFMWLKTYQTTPPTAGDFAFSNPDTTVDIVSLRITGDGTFPILDYDITPGAWANADGLTMDSTDFDNYIDGYRIGVVQADLGAGPRAQRVRIEAGKQYMVRFHVTSTQQSNLNPQLRLRVRTLRFGWVQKYEVGGAWAINTPEHVALASQALPGIGCRNPDKIGTENGGWYTVLVHSPMNPDIRPDVEGTLCDKMPNICAQPGPGVDADSIRDLKVGVDLLDTLSTSVNKDLEAGRFTVDRIEVFSFNTIPD